MPSPDDSRDFDAIHPDLEAAMARDGVPMMHLARLVDLDPRAVRRWGDAQRPLADFVAGRARAVRGMGGALGEEPRASWMLKVLADRGVPRAEVAGLADAAQSWLADGAHVLDAIRAAAAGAGGSVREVEKRYADDLRPVHDGCTSRPMLSTTAVQSVAREVDTADDGAMVTIAFRAPKAFKGRVSAAAKAHGMEFSAYLRAVAWMFSEPQK